MSSEYIWIEKLNIVKEYIDNNNKRPPNSDKNIEIKNCGSCITHQINNYKEKKEIMSINKIYNEWTDFINDDYYKQYFISNEESWNEFLNQVKKYIDDNNKRPSSKDKNENIKILGTWVIQQLIKTV
jgi:hypothetical protein